MQQDHAYTRIRAHIKGCARAIATGSKPDSNDRDAINAAAHATTQASAGSARSPVHRADTGSPVDAIAQVSDRAPIGMA